MAWQHNGHVHVAVSDLTLAQLKELARQCQASLEAGPFQESNMETVMAWFMHPGILGVWTRPFALLFIGEMLVAILSTKIALFLGTSPLPLPPVPPQTGFWAVLHESRSDLAQLLCSLFLLIEGPGPWSLDAKKDERPATRR